MATHLVKQGHDVIIHDVSAEARRAMVQAGASRRAFRAREVGTRPRWFTSSPSPAIYPR